MELDFPETYTCFLHFLMVQDQTGDSANRRHARSPLRGNRNYCSVLLQLNDINLHPGVYVFTSLYIKTDGVVTACVK
jgi:hypothetical protein